MKRFIQLSAPFSPRPSWVWVFGLLFALVGQSCNEFEYSPYDVRLSDDEKGINTRNIAQIEALPVAPSDTFRFILTADLQGFYKENEAMAKNIRARADIDFVLVGGDLTDFGLTKELKLIHQDLKTIGVPYVAIIGNHDAVNNGKEAFKAMYGDFDTSFAIGNSKFILLNTNHLEFQKKAPDLDWLEKELAAASSFEHVFVVSHIPPKNYEFGAEKAVRYNQLISQYNVRYSLHGHNHSFNQYTSPDGKVPFIETAAAEDREYLVFTVTGEKVTFERITF